MLVLLVGDPFMAHVLRYSVQGCCKVYGVCLVWVMVAMHLGERDGRGHIAVSGIAD